MAARHLGVEPDTVGIASSSNVTRGEPVEWVDASHTMAAVHRIEFTIEPFVAGDPGPHVTGPIDAIEGMGVAVEIGPFGSSCVVDDADVAAVSERLIRTALELGATRLNLDVSPESAE